MTHLERMSKKAKPIRQCDGCRKEFNREELSITSLYKMLCKECFNKRKVAHD